MAGFLKELHVRQYACLQDVRCTLTPLHAFIGPNDSGKSTLLRLIESLFVTGGSYSTDLHLFAGFSDGSNIRVNYDQGQLGSFVGEPGKNIEAFGQALHDRPSSSFMWRRVAAGEATAQLVRLDADELRQASPLIANGPLVLQGRGGNIAGLYDAVRDRSVERFAAISKQVTELFPTVKTLGLRAVTASAKVLEVTLLDENQVRSEKMSEGLLYYLAFAILAAIQQPAVYLVEEPENGLHPSRIKEVVQMLRALTEDPTKPVQVLMATHSPLVVNELRPEEVTVVTRDPRTGTKLTPIKETPHFDERSKIYALGELWLSYADGKSEAPLLIAEGR